MQRHTKVKILKNLGIVFATLILVLYFFGFRITSDFKLGRTGEVILNIPYKGTDIYINANKKITTEKDNDVVSVNLSPKTHKIIVALKDFYPWTKDVTVESNEKINLNPMFVSQNPSGFLIGELDPEYYKIKKIISDNRLPTKISPRTHTKSGVSVYVENNTIYTFKDGNVLEVLKSEVPIRNLDFYKNRSDVLMFSAGGGVYAIEVEKTGTQNFMPIYIGQKPLFGVETEKTIFVEDGNVLMQVAI